MQAPRRRIRCGHWQPPDADYGDTSLVAQKTSSVGDNVCFTLVATSIHGVVIDDHGPIGANRVHLFTVRIPNDPYDDIIYELPEDELALAEINDKPIRGASIMDYLKYSGLVQILQSNMSGGKNQPRVWLRRDNLGNVVHTFVAERGIVGGAPVPFSALRDNRIVAPKLKEVLTFLSTFDLS